MCDRPGSSSRVRTSEDKVRRKDMCWSVRIVYVLESLPDVSGPGLPGLGEAGRYTIAYGFTSDGREALVAGAGPVLDDWGRLVKRTTFSYVYDSNTTELSLWKLIHIYSVWLLLVNLFNWFTWHFICNGYGISAQAMTVVIRGYDGRGPEMELKNNILDFS